MSSATSNLLATQLSESRVWLRRIARALVGESAADDLVQQAMEKAIRKPPELDRPIKPWLRTILTNTAKMNWRSNRRRIQREEQALQVSATTAPMLPDEGLETLQTQQRVVSLVLALSEPYRQVIILRYVEGKSASEIAKQLQTPAATVRSHLRRGLALLRTELDEHSDRPSWCASLVPFMIGIEPPHVEPNFLSGDLSMKIALSLVTVAAVAGSGVIAANALHTDSPTEKNSSPVLQEDAIPSSVIQPIEPVTTPTKTPAASSPKRFRSRAARQKLADAITRVRLGTQPSKRVTYDFAGVNIWPGALDTFPQTPRKDFRVHSYIKDRLNASTSLLAECYELSLVGTPELAGVLTVDFTIDAEEDIGGYVQDISVKSSSTIDNAILSECVTETIQSLQFAAPESEVVIRVVYPFQFGNAPEAEEEE